MSTPPDGPPADQPENGQPIYGYAPIGQPQPVLGYFPAEQSQPDAPGDRPPPGQAEPGPAPYGQAQPGQVPPGQAQPGPAPYGQAPPGQTPYGQAPPAQAPYGQPQGQPGQAPYGQAPHGQPQPGQAPYGQGQPPLGTNPYGQPFPAAPQGQPPKSRRTLFLLIGGLVAAAVLAVVVLAAIGFASGDPRGTADEFMAALKAKDVDKAHSLLCKDGREKESPEELRSSFSLDARTITAYTLGPERTRERDGNEETLVPVTIDYDQGEPLRLDLGLWNEGGQKVCSLNPPGAG